MDVNKQPPEGTLGVCFVVFRGVDGDLERSQKLPIQRANPKRSPLLPGNSGEGLNRRFVELAGGREHQSGLEHERNLVPGIANARQTLFHLWRTRDRSLDTLLEVLNHRS